MNYLKLLVCVAIAVSLAATGCKKKAPGHDGNTTASATGQSSTRTQSAMAGKSIDQLRTEADTMSENQLRSSARQLASDYRIVQDQLKQKNSQLKSGGMIAGGLQNAGQIQQDVQQLQSKSQDLQAKYQVFATKLQEKGVQLPPLTTSFGAGGARVSEPNTPEPNTTGTTGQGGTYGTSGAVSSPNTPGPNSTGTTGGATQPVPMDTNTVTDTNRTQQG